MANELKVRIEQVSREKNLDPEVVIRAIEDAILQAAKRFFNNDEDLRSRFNHESGDIDVFAVKEVVEKVTDEEIEISLEEARELIPEDVLGMEIEFAKQTEGSVRIAAPHARGEVSTGETIAMGAVRLPTTRPPRREGQRSAWRTDRCMGGNR